MIWKYNQLNSLVEIIFIIDDSITCTVSLECLFLQFLRKLTLVALFLYENWANIWNKIFLTADVLWTTTRNSFQLTKFMSHFVCTMTHWTNFISTRIFVYIHCVYGDEWPDSFVSFLAAEQSQMYFRFVRMEGWRKPLQWIAKKRWNLWVLLEMRVGHLIITHVGCVAFDNSMYLKILNIIPSNKTRKSKQFWNAPNEPHHLFALIKLCATKHKKKINRIVIVSI